jgi:hypothetical protein
MKADRSTVRFAPFQRLDYDLCSGFDAWSLGTLMPPTSAQADTARIRGIGGAGEAGRGRATRRIVQMHYQPDECYRDITTTARSEIYSPPQASLNRRVRLDVFGCCYCAFISGWTSTITGTQYPSERAVSSPGRRLRFLFRRNREILEASALFGNVEGQRLHRRALAGVLHVVHFSGRGGERLTCLQVHSGLTLHLQGH